MTLTALHVGVFRVGGVGMPLAAVERCLRLLADEVVPALRTAGDRVASSW